MADLHSRLRSTITERLETARAATPGPWVVGQTSEADWGPFDRGDLGTVYYADGEQWPKHRVVRGTHIAAKGELVRQVADLRIGRGYPRSLFAQDAEHIATHDPASMISLYEGLLRIVDEHSPREVRNRVDSWGNPMVACDECWRQHPCPTLSILADSLGVDTGGTT